MHFMETIAIFITCIFALRMIDCLVTVAPFSQTAVDVVLIGVQDAAVWTVLLMIGRMVACCTLGNIWMVTSPLR